MHQEHSGVSLLVPTKNRSSFVHRLLGYYEQAGFAGEIVVGDSSDDEHYERTREVVETLEGSLDVQHHRLPHLGVGPCLTHLARVSTKPFAAVLPDDDFLVPQALAECVSFLKAHAGYAAAHGEAITVILDSNAISGNVVHCSHYQQPNLEQDTASERLGAHLRDYRVSLFSVHRRDTWLAMTEHSARIEDVTFAAEVLPCCHSVLHGKIRSLAGLYLVRQSHNLRVHLPSMFDWVVSPTFHDGYAQTVASLADALIRQQGLTQAHATQTARDALRDYFGLGIGLRRSLGRDDWMLQIARRLWGVVKALRPKPGAEWELASLMRSDSPHHAAFQPIYEALTTSPEEPEAATGR